MDFRALRDYDWQLFFIRAYTFLSFVWNTVSTQTVKSTKYLIQSFSPDIYCIFSGSSIPVRYTNYTHDVAGAAEIEYYYNRETKVISKQQEVVHIPRLLDIESARLFHGNICLYDLTDFFDSTRFAGSGEVPSLPIWISLWELENGIFLDRTTEFTIHLEFLGGGTIEITLWGGDMTAWNTRVSRLPRLNRDTLVRALLAPACSCDSTPLVDSTASVQSQPLPETTVSEPAFVDLSGNSMQPEAVLDSEGEEQDMEKVE